MFGGNSQFDWNFMNRVLELAPNSFDIMSVHPYGYQNRGVYVLKLRRSQ